MSDESNKPDLSEEGFEGTLLLNFMRDVLDQDPKLRKQSVKDAKATVVLTLKNQDKKTKSWFFEFKKDGFVEKIDGTPPKADVALSMSDVDFTKLINDEVNPQKLYMSGKLKIKGNLMKAVSLEKILRAADPRPKSKL